MVARAYRTTGGIAVTMKASVSMNACRGCQSSRLNLFLPLGSHPLANGFLKKEQLTAPEAKFPLDAHVCLDCGLIQIADQVPPEFFRNYVYVPSSIDTMHRHFADYARQVVDTCVKSPRSLVVDIGCNDGLFLGFVKERGVRTLGVDPATNIIQMARQKNLEVINEYFHPQLAKEIRQKHGPAAVIVTNNTFHHIGDLDTFTKGVTMLLEDSGIFIIEVPHAQEVVELNQFDGIYHEHVSQFTAKAFVNHLRRFDMEVFQLQRLGVHGGSMRVFARKRKGAVGPAVAEWISREAEKGLFKVETYDAFRARVEQIKDNLLRLLRNLKADGKKLAGYGASARGNTLLNYFGIGTDLLDYVVDRNKLKQGLYTPGMHIPVYSVEKILEDRPDYVLLLAWNFADEVIKQQHEYHRLWGKFILPIPEPRIV